MDRQIIYSLETIDSVVDQLHTLLPLCSIFTFTGTLGAGKTTLVQALLKRCGIQVPVVSPTFMYVIPYQNNNGQTFYHFDLYRMQNLEEFYSMGFDEYLTEKNSFFFIEWPEIISPILKHLTYCSISIDYHGIDQRILTYKIHKS